MKWLIALMLLGATAALAQNITGGLNNAQQTIAGAGSGGGFNNPGIIVSGGGGGGTGNDLLAQTGFPIFSVGTTPILVQ
jgi:hypothetical protein